MHSVGAFSVCDGVPATAASDVCHSTVFPPLFQPHCWKIMRRKRLQYQKYAQDMRFTVSRGIRSRFGRGNSVDRCQLAVAQLGQHMEGVGGVSPGT